MRCASAAASTVCSERTPYLRTTSLRAGVAGAARRWWRGWQHGGAVHRGHRARGRLCLLLVSAHQLLAVQRDRVGLRRVTQDHGAQEHHQVGLLALAGLALEEIAEHGHVAE